MTDPTRISDDQHNNAPAVPQGEPVAWMVTNGGPHSLYFSRMYADDAVWMAKNVCYKKSIPNDFQIHPLYATPAPSPAQEAMQSFTVPDDLPGMWEHSDLTGGETDCAKPAQEVATLSMSAEDVHAAFTKNFPKSRISQAWINFAADIAQAIAARAAKPAQEVGLTGCNCRWDGSEQVQWCELHLAHKDAIHEWAERAKTAEAKLDRLSSNQEVGLTDDQSDAVSMSLRRAWQLGQTYWQQADSDYISQHKKSEETQRKFEKLCDDTIAALRAKGGK